MYAAPPIANLLVLRSPDIERAAKFYQEMGLLFTRHSHGNGPEYYTSLVNGFVFEIYPLTPSQSPTTGTRIGFNVDSVDHIVPRLAEIGATIVTHPSESSFGRHAVVRDFDGHTIELLTPPNRDRT